MAVKVTPDKRFVGVVEELYKKHLRIDAGKGLLMFENTPVILARTELLYNIYKVLTTKIGNNDAYQLIYEASMFHGRSFYEYIAKTVKSADELSIPNDEPARDRIFRDLAYDDLISGKSSTLRQMVVRYLCLDSVVAGWGWISVEEGERNITITSRSGFPVAQEFKRRNELSETPVDAFFLGYFGGLLCAMDKREYKGEEVECVAKGDSNCILVYKW